MRSTGALLLHGAPGRKPEGRRVKLLNPLQPAPKPDVHAARGAPGVVPRINVPAGGGHHRLKVAPSADGIHKPGHTALADAAAGVAAGQRHQGRHRRRHRLLCAHQLELRARRSGRWLQLRCQVCAQRAQRGVVKRHGGRKRQPKSVGDGGLQLHRPQGVQPSLQCKHGNEAKCQ